MSRDQTRAAWVVAFMLALTLWLLLGTAALALFGTDETLRNVAAMALASLAWTIALGWWAWRER